MTHAKSGVSVIFTPEPEESHRDYRAIKCVAHCTANVVLPAGSKGRCRQSHSTGLLHALLPGTCLGELVPCVSSRCKEQCILPKGTKQSLEVQEMLVQSGMIRECTWIDDKHSSDASRPLISLLPCQLRGLVPMQHLGTAAHT